MYSTTQLDILLIEDNLAQARLTRGAIHHHASGLHVLHLKDGQEAVDFLSTEPILPRLILLDLHMPQVDGFEVLSWLRSQERFSTVPILIFSASADPQHASKALRLGATDFIAKPVSLVSFRNSMRSMIDTYLSRKQGVLM